MEIHEVRAWEHAVEWVERVVDQAKDMSIAVVGDFCLDHYIHVSDEGLEVSVETGLKTRSVHRSAVYAGGAGNLTVNLKTLGVARVHAIGVIGPDMYGRELQHLLRVSGVDIESLIVGDATYVTQVYTKVYEQGIEAPRLDLGDYNSLSADTLERVLDRIHAISRTVDLVLVNQQLKTGLFGQTSRVAVIEALRSSQAGMMIVDSRDYGREFTDVHLKMNEQELRRYHSQTDSDDAVSTTDSEKPIEQMSENLARTHGAPVIVTLGSSGCLVSSKDNVYEIPGVVVSGPVDTVGAGDAFLSGTAIAFASGLDLPSAASLGALVASVTIRKVQQPGTATQNELRTAAQHAEFRLAPLRVRTSAHSACTSGPGVEVIRVIPDELRTCAIFDHDGTISVLREGWEPVMFRLMVDAILGGDRSSLPPHRIRVVEERVRGFIDETTGIQSIEQMHGLVELIHEFSLCPASDILEPIEYKKRYLERLDARIEARLEGLQSGALSVEDFTIKGSVAFVQGLRRAGVTVFLASGSDHANVVNEASALGYAELFDGGIYGSVDDIANDPKRVVLETILTRLGEQHARQVVTFGDGPVEMRETLKRGGLAVGVASDEVRRYGLNPRKRTRLIEAGAAVVVGDFAKPDLILRLTGLKKH